MAHAGELASVSVVMPTYRRPVALAGALRGLAAQHDPCLRWDVVVVDNDPDGDAGATVDRMRPELPVTLRLVHERRPGSAHARNRGIGEATGDIIAFLDDDVLPDPAWLVELVEPIIAGRCDGTGGRVVLDPVVARPSWFDELALGGYLARFDLGPVECPIGADGFVLTANAAFRAVRLRDTGGFDVRLGPRGRNPLVCDDNLLTRKFMANGGKVRYVPTAIVTHELAPERLSRRYLLRRSYAQGRSDWILDDDLYRARRWHGARPALTWLGAELITRAREGPLDPAVAFHAATDLARTAGAVREMLARTLEGLRSS
jgi:glycosyltransferase involved in cell wall biosynthesis